MAKIDKKEDVLKKLGINPETAASIKSSIWQPWGDDEAHQDDPQGFTGVYRGYKMASKAIADKSGKDKINIFDLFAFDECDPAPKDGKTWLVASSFMLEDVKRAKPGTKITIVYCGSEKNQHGGKTPKIEAFFESEKYMNAQLLTTPLPPSNAEKVAAFMRLGGVGTGLGDETEPF